LANLTRIALLSEVAKREQAGRETRSTSETSDHGDDGGPLASIGIIARESVSSMSDIVWAVNPARESLLDLIRRVRQHADQVFTSRGIDLTSQETELLKLMVDGHHYKTAARQLGISGSTVSFHLKHIYEKLQDSKTEAVVKALRERLV
jgi:DNA-binding CsgD family transcriptional regulator